MEWFVRDICGYICIFFTYFTLTVVDLGVLFFSLKNRLLRGEALAWTHALIFNCIIATIVTAHVRCMTTNPGTLPKQTSLNYKKLPERTKQLILDLSSSLDGLQNSQLNQILTKKSKRANKKKKQQQPEAEKPEEPKQELDEGKKLLQALQRTCKKCDGLKPPRSHHCSSCGHCVARMDHHCPWVNNCVGLRTQKFFILFMFYVVVGCCYAGLLLYGRFTQCNRFNRYCGVAGNMPMFLLGEAV